MVMLSARAAAVGMDDGARMASVDATDAEAAGSKINPSTRRENLADQQRLPQLGISLDPLK